MPVPSRRRVSVSRSGYRVKDVGGYVPCLSFRLSFTFSSSRSFPMSLGDLRVSSIVDGRERVTYLCRFPPDLLVRLGLFGLLSGLFRSFLRHMGLQLCELLLLFFFRERLDLQGRPEGAVGCSFIQGDVMKEITAKSRACGVPPQLIPQTGHVRSFPRGSSPARCS